MKLYRKIYDDLTEQIRTGALKSGDRLPTEYELMRQYSVSRITAMNAVKLLAEDGLVQRVRKRGTFVLPRPTRALTTPLILPYNELINYDIITGAQQAAQAANCTVPFYNSHNDAAEEREILKRFVCDPPDGLLVYPCSTFENVDLINALYAKKVPIVFLDREILGTDYPVVTSDNAVAMFDLVSALIQRGARRLGYYGVHGDMTSTERDRFNGFSLGLAVKKIPLFPQDIFRISEELSAAYRLASFDTQHIQNDANRLLDALVPRAQDIPDVICCTNDYAASGLVQAATTRGIAVPDGFGVTGFDNLQLSETSAPPLTTVSQPFYELGRTAFITLTKLTAKSERVSRRIRVKTSLIFRGSTR